jgi:hypothetical protein
MRCGCTNPCPTCPLSEYLDQLQNNPVLTPDVPMNLLTRTFTIAAALPGFGVNVEAELNACVTGEADTQVAYTLLLDGAIMQTGTASRVITLRTGGLIGCFEGSVFAGEAQLAPGSHTIILQAVQPSGSGSTATIVGAAMRTELVAVPNLTTSLQTAV